MSGLVAFAVSAPSSGCGKTTVTMGLIAALRRRGLRVQPFKTGPDYIDSAYHSKLAGRPCINLDTWMTDEQFVQNTFARHARTADVAIIEGVMGLFDGAANGAGSTAQIAKLLDIPVLHVIDCGKAAQTAAAMLYGLEKMDPGIKSVGAIFNNIASPSHWESVAGAVAANCGSTPLGYLPKNPDLSLPERQLGLLSAFEHGLPDEYIDVLVGAIEKHINVDALLAPPGLEIPKFEEPDPLPASVRLGIARDEAFCFYYQDNLNQLEQAGIELVPFSPLNDPALPDNLDGLYLGGGFPEEFAARLSANRSMLESVRRFTGRILAECGGLIYLCDYFTAIDGTSFPMAGRIDGTIRMTDKLQACGYREATFNRGTILGKKGATMRGHEFHWSTWNEKPSANFGALQTGDHTWGYADDRIFASYQHHHFGSNPSAIHWFKEEMAR